MNNYNAFLDKCGCSRTTIWRRSVYHNLTKLQTGVV